MEFGEAFAGWGQYGEFSTYLHNEACSNDLADFGLKKGLDNLAQVREKLLAVTDRSHK